MARQQERARRTRAAIIRSAAVEFGKSGYAAASLNRILEGSRATKGAMYFHFDSKEDLARAVLDTALDRYRFSADRWLARTDLGPLDVMHGMLDEIALRLEHDIIVQAEFRLIIEPDFYREVPNGGGRIIARATRALAVRGLPGPSAADAALIRRVASEHGNPLYEPRAAKQPLDTALDFGLRFVDQQIGGPEAADFRV
ncbi:TetR/AcrR family transcriptional regulator, partial [Nocardia cyriacigeorgica]|uniref:TetR/AcrR family transcriptional regulator n=1 Tax=Nocardia cyriacigeorgica TaxID=135487 RepID=UPI002456AB15